MEEQYQLPPPGDKYHELLGKYWLDYSRGYPEPHYMLRYDGVDFSPLGGLQSITGHQKNGKTFLAAMFMAAVLNPMSERVRTRLPGLEAVPETLSHLGHLPRVLYIDTEMENLNTVKVARRVQWLCQWPPREVNERFGVLWLRAVDDDADLKAERWKLIQKAIEEFRPDFVMLDGIVDIVHDFNDNAECGQIIAEIMNIATRRDICVWTALHQNPGQEELGKMRGHLGTELANKSSDTFVCIKKKEAGDVTFTVKQVNARNKDVSDFRFRVTDEAGRLGVPQIIDGEAVDAESTETQRESLETCFADFGWSDAGNTYTELACHLKERHGITSNRRVSKMLKEAEAQGLLKRDEITKKFYNIKLEF